MFWLRNKKFKFLLHTLNLSPANGEISQVVTWIYGVDKKHNGDTDQLASSEAG